ncbi:formate dehydrogenase subunit alpha [Campylobacter sp. FMV-PI01]|uniref:Formate dehydrogenase subunit alpha n=3 Tax=Campylobacter portucalensis TaxID=2608384 RepID=A0A6L5WJF3_9BACT|nr:formate dehydrogenase subunit alpha [Campylobacter portucalensis]
MTNSLNDMIFSKSIFIMGANPAVNHPVGFSHFLKARENGAKMIVVDPRFTHTAAKADYFAQIRPGTDIAFMYGMLNIIFENGWEDKDFIRDRVYDMDSIKEEAKKWTPEVVEDVTGVKAEKLKEITEVYAKNSPGTFVWAMGLTQHTVGTSNTRLGPIVQLALGYAGKAGGGCNILRGHDNVQGASDMGCLSENLPGYYGLNETSWRHFANVWKVDYDWLVSRFVSKDMMHKSGFTLSRWWAGVLDGKDGNDKIHNANTNIKAFIVMGNGVTSTAQQAKVQEGLDNLELLVITDPFVNEAAVITNKQDNIFILPAATQFETSGTVVATNRSSQWRFKVSEPLFESKTDEYFLFELAKRLGFYDEYVRAMGDGKGNFVWPEDATIEIARGIKTIGYTGILPERLKKHTLNWDKFDHKTLKGFGECEGEYYGLPWPCWTQEHCGTPNLYDISKPVADGGTGFRNNFGLERDGVNLLAEDGSAPVDSYVNGGYPQITKANIESVLGITLTEEEKSVIGNSWTTDISGIIAKKCIEKGMVPYGNAKARARAWNFVDQIPLHREPLHSRRGDLVHKYPSFEDKVDHFRVDTKFKSVQLEKDYSKEFPINLITGRLVNLNGAGMENRASVYLSRLSPEMFCDINPNLAKKYDINNGDMIWVHSPEGTKIKVKARFTHSVNEVSVFLPFHFTGIMQGVDMTGNYPKGTRPYAVGESANTVANYGYDIFTQIPETKGGLCRIEKA